MDKQQLAIGAILVIVIVNLAVIFIIAVQPSHSGSPAVPGIDTDNEPYAPEIISSHNLDNDTVDNMKYYVDDAKTSAAEGKAVTVQIMSAGKTLTYNVEVASSPEEISRGLMFRTSLAPGAGMLFVFDDDADRYFWMENTLIPLDLIYISGGGRVVGVRENAVPRSTRTIPPPGPCRYVLEVCGGQCCREGVSVGDSVTINFR